MTVASSFPTGPVFIELGYLLDTSAAILLRDGVTSARSALSLLDERPVLSAITKVELEGGVHVRVEMRTQRRRRLDALLTRFAIIDFDAEMATIYGQIVAQAGFSRRKIIDRMIAATALSRDLTLITTNGGDFAEISDLKLEHWPLA